VPTTAEQLQVPIERNNHFLAFLQWKETIEAQYNRGEETGSGTKKENGYKN